MSVERYDSLAEAIMEQYKPVIISPATFDAFREAARNAGGKPQVSPQDERKMLLDALRGLYDRTFVVSGD